MTESAQEFHTLWGTPHSLYTGKIRSYLIKKGLPFRELCPTHPRFRSHIRAATQLKVAPVIETPDGEILQDTTDMIEYFEQRLPEPQMNPDTPVQRAVAWLISAYGSEGLLATAMSYRWSYREQQEHFLRAEFGRGIYAGPDRNARNEAGLKFMNYFNNFLPLFFGVTEETQGTIETVYLELLDALDIHFQHYPYVMGGRPSIADFGLMAPLYAHLARDPVPATLMKNRAPNVYRWTERMNRAGIADGEYHNCPEAYFPDDTIAPTLEPVLCLLFEAWGPETRANADLYNAWVSEHPELPAGHLVAHNDERVVHPTLGPIEYRLRDCTIKRASAPHGLWHFDRSAAYTRQLDGEAAERFAALVQRNGGEEMMAIRLARPMQRQDYVLVLGSNP